MRPEAFLDCVRAERVRARQRFAAFHSTHEAYAVILEELDEVWDAIKTNQPPSHVLVELIQVAAMCACAADECFPTEAKPCRLP